MSDCTLRIYDISKKHIIEVLKFKSKVTSMAFNPLNEQIVLLGFDNGIVKLWDTMTANDGWHSSCCSPETALIFFPGGLSA